MLSKENGLEDVQLVMDKDITFPDVNEVLYLAGVDSYLSDILDVLGKEEEKDQIIFDLESRWKFIESNLVDYSLEDSCTSENFILKDLINNKLYITELEFSEFEGYDIDSDIQWKEAEEITKTVTLYKRKGDALDGAYIYVNGTD